MIGIYKITNPKGKIYIGQSVDIEKRIYQYSILNCPEQPKIFNSLKKYGFDSHKFEILCVCQIEDLNNKERYYQEIFDVVKNGLNCKLTKTNDRSGYYSEESKLRMSIAQKGKKQSLITIQRRSISQTGKKQSQETINKRIASRKGYSPSKETRIKISLSQIGKKLSTETRLKMSKSRMGKKLSDSAKNKVSENNSKLLLNTETGIYYNSIKEASELLSIKYTTLATKLNPNCKNSSNNTNLIFV